MPAADAPKGRGSAERVRGFFSEVLFFGLSASLTASLALLFVDWSFFAPLLLNAFIAHLTIFALRRLRVHVLPAAFISLLLTILALAWVHYPQTTYYGIPWSETGMAVGLDIRESVDTILASSVPLPVQTGLLFMLSIVLWLVVFLGDWGAFRLGSSQVEVLAPAAAIYVALSFFGEGTARIWYAVLVVCAALAFSVVHPSKRSGHRQRPGDSPSRGIAGGLIAVAAVLLSLVGTRIAYGYMENSPFDLRKTGQEEGEEREGGRAVPSPLVSVQAQLRQLSNIQVFTVRASAPAYWRLTALETFDGESWSLRASHFRVEDNKQLPNTTPTADGNETIQSFSIDNLASVWLPAAYQPVSHASATEREVRFAADTSTLLLQSGSSEDFEYEVRSVVPSFEADRLRAVGEEDLGGVPDGLRNVPESVSASVRELSWHVVAGTSTPYDRALALQFWLRENFEYDLNVPSGHSGSHLDRFLFETRRGYCEQFTTAFAAMGRVVGLPTRVAVGFTSGEHSGSFPNGDALYTVRGRHAHTWPEVHLADAGWVAFEPTPGRGAPGAEAYTLLEPEQDASPLPSTTTTQSVSPSPTQETPPDPQGEVDPANPTSATSPLEGAPGRGGLAWWGRTLLALGGILGAYLLATTLLSFCRLRSRRLRGTRSPKMQVLVNWESTLEMLEYAGVRGSVGETPLELSRRAAVSLRMEPEPWLDLGRAVSYAGYSDPAVTTGLSQQTSSEYILKKLRSQLTRRQKLAGVVGLRVWGFRRGDRRTG